MRPLRASMLFVPAVAVLCVIVLLFLYPEPAFAAAVKGVAVWWDVLFPALFPFFLLSDIMLGYGVVHFFGTLLDPLMRPLFRVPGSGGFVMAMGFASGYPVTARLTAKLYEQGRLTRIEGERLVSFCTTADPIFLIGAVAVGFFHHPAVAAVLAAAHYGSAVLLVFVMRFYGKERPAAAAAASPSARGERLLSRALAAMHEARIADGRPLGELIRQAIANSLQLVFIIGGLVVFFSVVMEVMTISGILDALHKRSEHLLRLVGFPPDLSASLISGLFEVTIGAKAAGETAVGLREQAAVAGFVLAWAGLSVHAQIVSLMTQSPIRYLPFAAARLIHGALAFLLTLALWEPFTRLAGSQAAASLIGADPRAVLWQWGPPAALAGFVLLLTAGIALASLLHWFSKRMYNDA